MQNVDGRGIRRVVLGVALLGFAACGDEIAPLPTEKESDPFASVTARALGAPAHQALARMVAHSMRDAETRAAVHQAMLASPMNGGKLHLETYLRGKGGGLLNAMGRANGVGAARVWELMSEAPAMEMYLPVEEPPAVGRRLRPDRRDRAGRSGPAFRG